MKKYLTNSLLTFLFFISIIPCFAQFYSVEIIITNQPDQQVVLGILKGDNFLPIDSTLAKNEVVLFKLPEESKPGMYRLNLGQTTYARIMEESPQKLDFIFNKENIVLETDFKTPEKSIRVIQSDENKIWFAFKQKADEFTQQISILEQELNMYQKKGENTKAIETATPYNILQMECDLFIKEFASHDSNLLVTQFVKSYKTVILDGYLSEKERKEIFQKQYFDGVSFENEVLIYSQCYTDNIFYYLKSFNDLNFTLQQREEAYKNAVDIILAKTNKNKEVYSFIVEYLKHGFEVLKMENLVNYLSNK